MLTLYNENCTKDAVRKAIKTAGCANMIVSLGWPMGGWTTKRPIREGLGFGFVSFCVDVLNALKTLTLTNSRSNDTIDQKLSAFLRCTPPPLGPKQVLTLFFANILYLSFTSTVSGTGIHPMYLEGFYNVTSHQTPGIL